MRKPILIRAVLAAILLVFVGLAVAQARQHTQLKLHNDIEIKSKEAKLLELDNKYNDLLKDKHQDKQDQLKKIKELEQEKAKLEEQLQAKRNKASELQRIASGTLNKLTGTRQVSAEKLPQNGYKSFIYQHESGNNPNATNSIGCYGLGQDCNGIVRNKCGANYACQDRYFTNYAQTRYNGWEGAKAFWLIHHWW